MKYFLDFDRTIFDTPSFKKSVARRPTPLQLIGKIPEVVKELFNPEGSGQRFRTFRRMLGTFASHGRFNFSPEELRGFLYPDVESFFARHDCTIVTYGVEAFIRAKVAGALTDLKVTDVIYTPRKKGKTIRKLTEGKEGPFVFVDDAHFQLESVAFWCPDIRVIEIRRDGQEGDGRWPVVTTLDELPAISSSEVRSRA